MHPSQLVRLWSYSCLHGGKPHSWRIQRPQTQLKSAFECTLWFKRKPLSYLSKIPHVKEVKGVKQLAVPESELVVTHLEERPDVLQAEKLGEKQEDIIQVRRCHWRELPKASPHLWHGSTEVSGDPRKDWVPRDPYLLINSWARLRLPMEANSPPSSQAGARNWQFLATKLKRTQMVQRLQTFWQDGHIES